MKVGAILVASIFLVEKIIFEKTQAKYTLKNFIRNNKYIGSNDRKFLYDITFNILKKYHSLLHVCKAHNIDTSIRNLVLFNFCNKFKNYNLEDLYQGKYSLKKKKNDTDIYKIAISFKDEILPRLPDWIEKKILNQSEEEKKKLYKSMLAEPKFDIAINIKKYSRHFVKKKLNEFNINCNYTKSSSVGITINNRIPNYKIIKIKRDMFEVQDEGSQLMTLLIMEKPKMKILDFCAGKGTKTILMSNLLKSECFITAFDKFEDRLEVLKKRVKELNLKNINFNFKNKNNENYDLVVCDVPCTGIGTWRRRPENIIWLESQELEKLKLNQKKILLNASKLCKNGGQIAYITCSLLYDENEFQIKNFLNNNKNFSLISTVKDTNYCLKKNLLKYSEFGITLKPDSINTDGYFISILKKLA